MSPTPLRPPPPPYSTRLAPTSVRPLDYDSISKPLIWMLVARNPPPMSDDDQRGGGDGQRQCRRRGISVDVELGAALALADMAAAAAPGVDLALGPAGPQPTKREDPASPPEQMMEMTDEEGMVSTRLSLELGKVGIHSSSCSSSSSAGRPVQPASSTPAPPAGHTRPRHMLAEAEKEAKRLRRVLANRESARQTILRRQAIRDELARKIADLSSQNENMKKEKDLVMKEYLSLKETNKQLRAQARHLSLSLF